MENSVTDKPAIDQDALTQLVQWFEAADQSTVESRGFSERDRDYYDHKQWTEDEENTLKMRGQPIITSNRIKPKIDFMLGLETQRRTLPRGFPRNPGDEDGANAVTDALRYVCEENKWDRTRSACFSNLLIEGTCGVDVTVRKMKNGDHKVEIAQIEWDRQWYDPHSRKRDFSDAKYLGQDIWMDADDAISKWQDAEKFINSTISGEATTQGNTFDDVPRTRWADPKRKRVRISECWSHEDGKVFYSVFTKSGVLKRTESTYKDEEGEQDSSFVFGSCFVDRDGNRYGIVRGWISIQDEINKRRSKALHILSVNQTIGEKGAVDDVNEAKKQLAKPDGHVEITPGMKFEKLDSSRMAADQFQLLQESKNEIDAVAVNAALSGNENRNMSGRALMARSEQGLAELGPVYDAMNQFQHDVYRKVWNRIKQFWTAEKWIRITEDDNNVKFVGLNQPLLLWEQMIEQAKKQGQQVTPEMEQQAKSNPALQQVVGVRNNVAELDVDIEIADTPATASLQIEQFEAITKMAQSGMQFPPEIIIEASNLRNKDKILKMMNGGGDIPPQVKQQMQQMQEALQQMQQALQEAQAQANDKAGEMKIKQAELFLKEKELQLKEMEIQSKAPGDHQVEMQLEEVKREIERQATQLEFDRKTLAFEKKIATFEIGQHFSEAVNTEQADAGADMGQQLQLPTWMQQMQQPINITVPVTVEGKGPVHKQGRAVRQPDGSYVLESIETSGADEGKVTMVKHGRAIRQPDGSYTLESIETPVCDGEM